MAGVAGKRLLVEYADPETILDERLLVHEDSSTAAGALPQGA
ncbi:MAG: hypothetical protein U1E76_21875 [Planctomycetota bacterium]